MSSRVFFRTRETRGRGRATDVYRRAGLGAALLLGISACSVYDDALLESRATAGQAIGAGQASASGAVTGGASGSLSGAAGGGATDAAAGGGSGSPDGGTRAQACVEHSGRDYCSLLPEIPAAPVIDGEIECGLEPIPLAPIAWNGSQPLPSVQAHYAAGWRADGLYVYVAVTGAPIHPHPAAEPIYCGDAVEIYVDGHGDDADAGAYEGAGAMQFVIAAPDAVDGYAIEALITGPDIGLWEWAPKQQLSFGLAVDVSAPADSAGLRCGLQLGQFFLRVAAPSGACSGEPWCDVRAFCDAALE
jgi:hypothetical protein